MLMFLTVAVVLAVAYAHLREGLLTALTTVVNLVAAGLVAFNFFEPLAGELGKMFQGSFLAGFEDALALFLLFAITLGVLRLVTNNLASEELDLPARVNQVGAGVAGMVAGYLLAGFLVCVLQTLPWRQDFLGFDHTADTNEPGLRKVLPPDRVWLAMMHHAGLGPFAQTGATTFDPEGTFELRYARLRRFKEPTP